MNKKSFAVLFLTLSILSLGMGRQSAQYDEEAREQEQSEKQAQKHPMRNMASGVKQATVDSTADLIEDTREDGLIEGPRKGSKRVLDNTVQGAVKVATLGYANGENYEVKEPEAGSEEPTKIKFKIPGT